MKRWPVLVSLFFCSFSRSPPPLGRTGPHLSYSPALDPCTPKYTQQKRIPCLVYTVELARKRGSIWALFRGTQLLTLAVGKKARLYAALGSVFHPIFHPRVELVGLKEFNTVLSHKIKRLLRLYSHLFK